MTQDNKPRDYHFGTDIPIPTWQEVEAERSENDQHEGMGLATIMALALGVWLVIAMGIFVWLAVLR
jgi:hypothetical protein